MKFNFDLFSFNKFFRMKYVCLAFLVLFGACNWAKHKAKETVNKTGEVVAQTGSEFVNGVSKGIEKTFANEGKLSEQLIAAGLKPGKMTTHGSDSTTDNVLTAYLIFEKDFNQQVTAKVFDERGQEYGRSTLLVKAQKGEAKYFDFIFDQRTNIDGKGVITFE
jgi:hypothetical protein